MLNLSDKELDRLSREAAEKFEVDQDPAAWNRLEQLLDKELGRSSPIPKFSRPGLPLLYTPVIIILIGATYFLLKPSKHTRNSTLKNYSSESKKKTAAPPGRETQYQDKITPSKTSSPSDLVDAGKEVAITKPAEKGKKLIETKKTIPPPLAAGSAEKEAAHPISGFRADKKEPGTISGQNQKGTKLSTAGVKAGTYNNHPRILNTIPGSKKVNRGDINPDLIKKDQTDVVESGNLGNSAENRKSTLNNPVQDKNNNGTAPEASEIKPVLVSGILPVLSNTTFIVNDSILSNLKLQDKGLTDPGKGKNGRHYYTNRSLQIGILFSPDFSEVRYNYENKVGTNLGFSLSYQLSAKVALNSGLVFTNKNYTAIGYDFHAPPAYWTNRVDLEFVKANCRMLEIPLNLRYDFNTAGNTTFFINGGFSSYLLKKESYDFFYHTFNFGMLRQTNTEYTTGHNYWLSVLNLSTGFETKISNSFSFQIEPYMKLPLTGIGLGKVDLSSYGINLSIKFSPILKQGRR
jgi:hypothetical protein